MPEPTLDFSNIPLYDLEIACVGGYTDFPEHLTEMFEALLPVATSKHFFIVGMCFVGRGLNDNELDELQQAEDDGYILGYCCKRRNTGATIPP